MTPILAMSCWISVQDSTSNWCWCGDSSRVGTDCSVSAWPTEGLLSPDMLEPITSPINGDSASKFAFWKSAHYESSLYSLRGIGNRLSSFESKVLKSCYFATGNWHIHSFRLQLILEDTYLLCKKEEEAICAHYRYSDVLCLFWLQGRRKCANKTY